MKAITVEPKILSFLRIPERNQSRTNPAGGSRTEASSTNQMDWSMCFNVGTTDSLSIAADGGEGSGFLGLQKCQHIGRLAPREVRAYGFTPMVLDLATAGSMHSHTEHVPMSEFLSGLHTFCDLLSSEY